MYNNFNLYFILISTLPSLFVYKDTERVLGLLSQECRSKLPVLKWLVVESLDIVLSMSSRLVKSSSHVSSSIIAHATSSSQVDSICCGIVAAANPRNKIMGMILTINWTTSITPPYPLSIKSLIKRYIIYLSV